MPFTPYHFGPSGLVGLVFRKYIDIPVFVLASVAVDIEVLVISALGFGRPVHRYCHTLLIGPAAGIVWAIAAYLLRHPLKKMMRILHIPYEASFCKMVISGILGAWFHVLIDAVYHYDVRLFWPNLMNPVYKLLTKGQVRNLCIGFFVLAIIKYVFIVKSYVKQNKAKNSKS